LGGDKISRMLFRTIPCLFSLPNRFNSINYDEALIMIIFE
jgi:hypothetical protein